MSHISTYLIVIVSILSFQLSAQSIGDRYIGRITGSLYSGLQRTQPMIIEIDESGSTYETAVYYDLQTYGALMFDPKFNLVEISDNLALSLNLGVEVNASFGEGVFGEFAGLAIHVPAALRIDFGAGSTLNTLAGVGGFAGAGVMLNAAPLLRDPLPEDQAYQTIFATPIAQIGVNWYAQDRLMGLLIQGWYNSPVTYVGFNGEENSVRGYFVQLSYSYYLNY